VFLGTHFPRLDDKGRLILPAKYRDEMEGGLVITKGQERCLYIWPTEEFARIAESVRSAPATSASGRGRVRLFFASASDETPDKQGRVTVPHSLREYAGLDRDCVLIGASSKVELWDAQAWQDYLAEQDSAYAEDPAGVIPGVV
jgi:MraZ protein